MDKLEKTTSQEIVKISKSEFITKYDPARMVMEYRHVNSIAKAIEEDGDGLSLYVKQLGYDTVSAVIELHLLALNTSVNVGQPLSKFQIKEIAVELLATYYYLSPVEIGYIFRRIKRGDYGKLYGALNMPDLLGFFGAYAEERASHYINLSTKDIHNDHSLRSEDREIWARHEKLINKNQPPE